MKIIQDTREKQPWDFDIFGCETYVQTLQYGDYSIKGLEDVIRIERKRSTGEIACNLGQKLPQFRKELERMCKLEYPIIICEFSMNDVFAFPNNSGIPPKVRDRLKMSGKYLAKMIYTIQEDYNIQLYLCGDKFTALGKAYDIMKEVYEAKTNP